jgi:hypothetical protein
MEQNTKDILYSLNYLMEDWNYLPKKFILKNVFQWGDVQISQFIKEYNKQKKKTQKVLFKSNIISEPASCENSGCCTSSSC